MEGCLSKKEELAQRKKFDDQIVEKHNLSDRGWYDGTRAAKNIKFNPTAGKSNNMQVGYNYITCVYSFNVYIIVKKCLVTRYHIMTRLINTISNLYCY